MGGSCLGLLCCTSSPRRRQEGCSAGQTADLKMAESGNIDSDLHLDSAQHPHKRRVSAALEIDTGICDVAFQTLSGEIVARLSVKPAETVGEVKHSVKDACGKHVADLIWGERVLLDHETLAVFVLPRFGAALQVTFGEAPIVNPARHHWRRSAPDSPLWEWESRHSKWGWEAWTICKLRHIDGVRRLSLALF